MSSLPDYDTIFSITFDNGHTAQAVRVRPDASPKQILNLFELSVSRPVIFISGGASKMSDEDKRMTERIIAEIVDFAEEHSILIIDGGTESGVMKMVGDTRHDRGYKFPLVGVSPLGRVAWPGYDNPDQQAMLEDSHTHFVLVDTPEWGGETMTIVRMTYAICGENRHPAMGVLVNGGKIAMQEMYLASTYPKARERLALAVIEGSGRAADEISAAVRTGGSHQRVLQAIVDGADVQLVATDDGPQKMREMLLRRFVKRS
ncbi:MAG: hypothetical protein EA396_02485 [Anaerolineaceae bacterium]|nr:MAG: hypothetical protein EA396_02485 [Anaerolineaceae bacterium]